MEPAQQAETIISASNRTRVQKMKPTLMFKADPPPRVRRASPVAASAVS